MKENFEDYCKSIDLTDPIIVRIRSVVDFFSVKLGITIEDILITEYIKEDGGRVYESIWLFSDNYCMEAKSFLDNDDFDMVLHLNNMVYWSVKKQDFEFDTPNENSRLFIRAQTKNLVDLNLKASKNNCHYLKEIFLKYILQNVS